MYDEFDNKDEMNYQGTDGVTSEGAGTEPEPTYYGGGENRRRRTLQTQRRADLRRLSQILRSSGRSSVHFMKRFSRKSQSLFTPA